MSRLPLSPYQGGVKKPLRIATLTLLLFVLAGCASPIPMPLREFGQPDVSLATVQRDPETFLGRSVRWGGEILEVRNAADRTRVLVLATPLDAQGQPTGETSTGRFIAEFPGFVDPSQFPSQSRVTVVGALIDIESEPIGDYNYPYPVVSVIAHYVWPRPEPIMIGYPWGYGLQPDWWWRPGYVPFGYDPWCCGPSWYGPGWRYGVW